MNASKMYKVNRSKANERNQWQYELTNKDRKLLAQIKATGAPMVSARRLANTYNLDPVAIGNNFRTLKDFGFVEKWNSRQWQLTEKGEEWEL